MVLVATGLSVPVVVTIVDDIHVLRSEKFRVTRPTII